MKCSNNKLCVWCSQIWERSLKCFLLDFAFDWSRNTFPFCFYFHALSSLWINKMFECVFVYFLQFSFSSKCFSYKCSVFVILFVAYMIWTHLIHWRIKINLTKLVKLWRISFCEGTKLLLYFTLNITYKFNTN